MKVTCSLHVECCPLCQQDHRHATLFNRVVEHGTVWQYHMCGNCGLVYQSPQMTDDELANYYGADYWRIQGQDRQADDAQLDLQTARAEHLLALVPDTLPVSRFLDIGCAAGCMLRVAERRFSSVVRGIELSDPFRRSCEESGRTVYATSQELLAAGEAKFDCISMSHVLEHIRRPIEFLIDLRRNLLQPQGCYILEVPNLYAHRAFEPAHPICFNESTLRATLAVAGFDTLAILVHHHPRAEINRPLYIAALATPSVLASGELDCGLPNPVQFQAHNVWLERVKRAYVSKRGAWWRQVWKGTRVSVQTLFTSDLQF
jgi:2-polyprenyl-3-methyl-5-hydroxy-6-metoxy-1,4-benzoquinol methylase